MSTPIPTITVQPPTPCPSPAPPPPLGPSTTTTTYHIYRSGAAQINWILHTVPDRDLPSLRQGAKIVDPSCPGRKLRKLFGRGAQRETEEEIILDDPNSDPREPSYYMHTPRICFQTPPQSVRLGGKGAPVVCLVDRTLFWRRWTLSFVVPEKKEEWWRRGKKKKEEMPEKPPSRGSRVDSGFADGGEKDENADSDVGIHTHISLNAPGIIDDRGVVAEHYPRRPFRLCGKTGCRRRQKSASASSSVPAENPPALPEHLTPSIPELRMYWNGWWTREYRLQYGDIDFRWKGTATVSDERKFWGSWSKYNHLKLVAYLPTVDDGASALSRGSEGKLVSGKREVEVARYTSIWATRKIGRLEVLEEGLKRCCPLDEVERERVRHFVVSTALCMVAGEKEKRQAIRDTILALIGAGVDAAPS